jgi:toluene monooxygenase system protein E
MSEHGNVVKTRRPKTKTWSRFGNLGRKPNEYEVVTHDMNHTISFATPLEMGPEVHGNVWLKLHRDSIPLSVPDWNAFRDPDRMTYRKYTTVQDQQETYVDGLLAEFTSKNSDASLAKPAVDLLAAVFTPSRYLGHAQQMLSAYVQQLAPSSYIANAATFQTADQLRRVQLTAYRTKQLAETFPDRNFGAAERGHWEKSAAWQPLRELVERLLLAFDWHDAFIGTQLVLKPIADRLTLHEFAKIARSQGDDLDALIADNLYKDAERSRRWTVACTRFLIEAAEGNRAALLEALARWRKLGEAAIAGGAGLLGSHAGSASASIGTAVQQDWAALIAEAGLAGDG